MLSKTYKAEREKICHIICLEKSVIRQIIKALNSKEISEELIAILQKNLEEYYYYLCLKGSEYPLHARIESFLRVVRFLFCYPVKYHIDASITGRVYDKMRLLDMATYCLYQLCDYEIRSAAVDSFLCYIKYTDIGKISTIYAYRVAPVFIRNKYNSLKVEDLTEKELYYGITTGLYEYEKGGNPAIKQLRNICAEETLCKLAKEGFLIS